MWGKNKAVIIGVIIGLVLGYIFGAMRGSDKPEMSEQESLLDEETMEESGNTMTGSAGAMSVAGQPAGSQVRVTSVSVSAPTWVAVREDAGGVPGGSILGAALLSTPGTHRDVLVELLAPTSPATRYHVNLFTDNGDRAFDHRTDLAVMTDGKLADAAFTTQ